MTTPGERSAKLSCEIDRVIDVAIAEYRRVGTVVTESKSPA